MFLSSLFNDSLSTTNFYILLDRIIAIIKSAENSMSAGE